MARLTQRTNNNPKSKKSKDPDIQAIRKQQARKALELARTIDEKAFTGIRNDTYYYIVVRENDKADEIVELFKQKDIPVKNVEYSWMSDDTAIYLADEEPKTENDSETNETEE